MKHRRKTGHRIAHQGWASTKNAVGNATERDVLVGYRKEGAVRAPASIYRDLESLRAELALASDDDQAALTRLHTAE